MHPVVPAIASVIALWSATTLAQVHGGGPQHHGVPTPAKPYAGFEQRTTKALSDEQIADLQAGRGMGLALAAELNGYPGPLHVLELADALGLSPEQRRDTDALLKSMRAEAIAMGTRILAEEAALDRLFARRTITVALLDDMTTRIGAAQAELRAMHLRYHLRMAEVLTTGQATDYARLRGYGRQQ